MFINFFCFFTFASFVEVNIVMSSTADAYTYSDSTSSSSSQPVYTSKQWSYSIDQSNSNYSSRQIVFDLSGFYNSQRFINPQEMFILFPVVTTLSANSGDAGPGTGLGAAPHLSAINTGAALGQSTGQHTWRDNGGAITSQFAYGPKSGNWNLIQSMQVQVDGKDVIQLTPNINYHASFCANTTWSKSDLDKNGGVVGFFPDAADSWMMNSNGTYSNFGYGVCNNALPGSFQPTLYPGMEMPDSTAGSTLGILGQVFGSSHECATACGENAPFFERMKRTNRLDPVISGSVASSVHINGGPTSFFEPKYGKVGIVPQTTTDATLENHMYATPAAILGAEVIVGTDADKAHAFRQTMTTCVVRFKDICDLFGKLPLTRGLYMRVTINVNTGYIRLGWTGAMTTTPADPATALPLRPQYGSITQNTFPATCPIMLAPTHASALSIASKAGADPLPITINRPFLSTFLSVYPTDANIQIYPGLARDIGSCKATELILSVAIGKPDPIHKQIASTLALKDHPLQNCRIYAPIIDMEPALITSYITNFTNHAVYYKDVLQFSIAGVKSSGLINTVLANGIVNAKRLVIIPFYHDDTAVAASTFGTKIPFEPLSCFSSAPGTCAPMNSLIDFNIQVSNMNIFQRNISYSFENFIEEMSPANAINGGLDTGLTSGLVGIHEWTQAYKYYVVDLSRRLAGDNTPKSITVLGRNGSSHTVDYYCYVEYERHLSLNVESGHISVSSN